MDRWAKPRLVVLVLLAVTAHGPAAGSDPRAHRGSPEQNQDSLQTRAQSAEHAARFKHAYSQSANVLHTCSFCQVAQNLQSERQTADDLFQLAEKFELNYPAGVCGWTQSPEDHAGL